MNSDRPRVTRPRANTPTVWVTVTVRPRMAACCGVPRVPTRYAATIDLPWPGLSACSRSPEERDQQREGDEARAQLLLRDEPREPGLAALVDGDAGVERLALRERRRGPGPAPGSTASGRSARPAGWRAASFGYARSSSLTDCVGAVDSTTRAGVVPGRRLPSSRRGRRTSSSRYSSRWLPGRRRGEPYTDSNRVVRRPATPGGKPSHAGGDGGKRHARRPAARAPTLDLRQELRRGRPLLEGRDLGEVEDVEDVDAGRPRRRRGCSGWW